MSVSASKPGNSVSVLAEAARHETALMAGIAAAEQEAQGIIGTAHEQAAALLTDSAHRTERDIAQMRQQAAADRDRTEGAITEEAAAKVADIRAKAAPNLDQIRKVIVSRILPTGVQS